MSETPAGPMTPQQFVAKWEGVELSEAAASQEHFLDLCRLLRQPTPAEHDKTGADYSFQRKVGVTDAASKGSKGEYGFVDAWWRGKFGWEYKRRGKHKDLTDAYRQLCQYREDLENPPLLVVCDIARTEIHTNFTGYGKEKRVVALSEIADPSKLDILRRVFSDPFSFRPDRTAETVTREVAEQFGALATSLRKRGYDTHTTAHFLMKCMFCLFAEDVDLLPNRVFTALITRCQKEPGRFKPLADELFGAMRKGGDFGVDAVPFFNGGLFDDAPAIDLIASEVDVLKLASKQDWGGVAPHIFGTLFERSLDPGARAQIGAHYTSRDDILLVVEPVILASLRREWEKVKENVNDLIERRRAVGTKASKKKHTDEIDRTLQDFDQRIASVRVLDPACGSGNFLYVALQNLLDLEKEVIAYAAPLGLGLYPQVRPTQLAGIEINPYAAELAQVVIWIGYLQWMRENGFIAPTNPILDPLNSIECRDAILDLKHPAGPRPAAWPEADFIIGNPPFLGSKLFRANGLSDDYLTALYAAFDLPKTSDLCCYWFEQARTALAASPTTRTGLLATQGIRGGDNRTVLERITHDATIFMAWSDRDWILDGANVHVSIVGFARDADGHRVLDGNVVAEINADLTSGANVSSGQVLGENKSIAFMGDTKVGAFDIDEAVASRWLRLPNPNGRSNAEVVRPWVNGLDVTRRPRNQWIVDFPPGMSEEEAAGFEAPYEHITTHVRDYRATARSGDRTGVAWWIHQRPRPDMRSALAPLSRFIATPTVAKFRLFVWLKAPTLPDHQLIVFAREDDYFFGVLHSAVHERWARRLGTQLREAESGFRYTPTTCFETFPFPRLSGGIAGAASGPAQAIRARIAAAAASLNEQRSNWLTPTEGLAAAELKRRTLTNLYNERPTWLQNAHIEIDRAVLAAYGWPEAWADGLQPSVTTEKGKRVVDPTAVVDPRVEEEAMGRLLALNAAQTKRAR